MPCTVPIIVPTFNVLVTFKLSSVPTPVIAVNDPVTRSAFVMMPTAISLATNATFAVVDVRAEVADVAKFAVDAVFAKFAVDAVSADTPVKLAPLPTNAVAFTVFVTVKSPSVPTPVIAVNDPVTRSAFVMIPVAISFATSATFAVVDVRAEVADVAKFAVLA